MVGTAQTAPLPTLRLNYFPFTILRQCCHAASIRFSLASGVRNPECADSATLGTLARGSSTPKRSLLETPRPPPPAYAHLHPLTLSAPHAPRPPPRLARLS